MVGLGNRARRDHPLPFGGEDPEGDELAGIDLLLDLDDLQVDGDLVGVSVTVQVAPENNGLLRHPRDRGLDKGWEILGSARRSREKQKQ